MDEKEIVFWKRFLKDTEIKTPVFGESWAFGGSPDELANLVLQGKKTATASAKIEYEWCNEALPKANEHYDMLLDGNGNPVAILMTTKVYVTPFNQVSSEHAHKEGEGDLSLAYWRDAHYKFWKDLFQKHYNKQVDIENMDVVCEEFKVVYQ